MAQARELDVVITDVLKATVKYRLYVGGRNEEWRVPNASSFDLSKLVVGSRYKVWTTTIWSDEYNFRKGHNERVPRYEWVSVKELPLDGKPQTKSAKQAEFSKLAASMPLVGGDLFQGL